MKKPYSESIHFFGRLWTAAGIVMILLAPVAICVYYDAWPELTHVLKGMLGVAPVFWTVGIIEVFTFTPMLGAGGSYLGFITGNLSNLKVPCALNAMEAAKVKPGTEEGEVISTIAVASSAIVNTLILTLGVLLLLSSGLSWNPRRWLLPLPTSCPHCLARWRWCMYRRTGSYPSRRFC